MDFEVVIGIEVHAQLRTKTKLFCACPTTFGSPPNQHTCPVCLALPGALPVLNETAVNMAIQAGLALNCTINPTSIFARKNYFYPDLPKGYQISQFELPLCSNGYLLLDSKIRIQRIHMEEDAGKLVHQGAAAIAGSTASLVDLNRAGTPLIEIVSEPDIRSAKEARLYVERLKSILQFIEVCDGNLEEGSLRADANISLRPYGEKKLGTRTEIKNLNSFRSIERALLFEIDRQTQLLMSGKPIIQQTRHYDDTTQQTQALRDKEESHDYRYFPDPDLKPLKVSQDQIQQLKNRLPELPQAKKHRYQTTYKLNEQEIEILISGVDINQFFEQCVALVPPTQIPLLAKWMIGDVNAIHNTEKTTFCHSFITPEKLSQVLNLIESKTISPKMAKTILTQIAQTGEDIQKLLQESGGTQVSDTGELEPLAQQVIAKNPDIVEKIRNGKTQSINFLVGQIMKATKGRANPDLANQILKNKLNISENKEAI